MLIALGIRKVDLITNNPEAMVIDTLGTGLFLPFTILYFLATTTLPVAEIALGLAIAAGVSLSFGPV